MSKTYFNHHIHEIKGEEYIFKKEYDELAYKLITLENMIEFTLKCKFADEYTDLFIKDLCNGYLKIIKGDDKNVYK